MFSSMSTMFFSSTFLVTYLSMGIASPAPNPHPQDAPPQCDVAIDEKYTVTERTPFEAPAVRVGGKCCTAPCSIAAGEEHTIGITKTVGASLDLSFKDIASVGITSEISWSVEDTKTLSVEVQCADGYICCLQTVDKKVRVKGQKISEDVICHKTETDDYEIEAPQTIDGKAESIYSACISEDSESQEETDSLKRCPK